MITYYAADFGFIEEAKVKKVREIPPDLDVYRTTNYFGKSLVLKTYLFVSLVSCQMHPV